MRILFMDNYFPGHFRFLAPYMAEKVQGSSEHEIIFLSEFKRKDFADSAIRQIGIRYTHASADMPPVDQIALNTARQVEAFKYAMVQLKRQGLIPDIIIGADICMAEAASVFPDVCRIGYFDWYYSSFVDNILLAHGKLTADQCRPLHLRNPWQLTALLACHCAIVPTQGQKDSYPVPFQQNIAVLPMGVDSQFFRPRRNSDSLPASMNPQLAQVLQNTELITWSARNPSEYTGFSTICNALLQILAARPQAHALLVSQNLQAMEGNEHCQRLQENFPKRTHLIGQCTWNEYRAVLQHSSAHLYLSATPPLPTSLLEAMSCGCLILGSDTKSIRSVIQHGENGFLSDFFNPVSLADAAIKILQNPVQGVSCRKAARNLVLQQYTAQKLIPAHVELIGKKFEAIPPAAQEIMLL